MDISTCASTSTVCLISPFQSIPPWGCSRNSLLAANVQFLIRQRSGRGGLLSKYVASQPKPVWWWFTTETSYFYKFSTFVRKQTFCQRVNLGRSIILTKLWITQKLLKRMPKIEDRRTNKTKKLKSTTTDLIVLKEEDAKRQADESVDCKHHFLLFNARDQTEKIIVSLQNLCWSQPCSWIWVWDDNDDRTCTDLYR